MPFGFRVFQGGPEGWENADSVDVAWVRSRADLPDPTPGDTEEKRHVQEAAAELHKPDPTKPG